MAFWKTVTDELDAGRGTFLALVAACTKGSPGTPGARMLLTAAGEQVGTIGGGRMELDILRQGRERLAAGDIAPRFDKLHHYKNAPGVESGLICSGTQTNLTVCLDPARDGETIRAARALVEADAPGWLHISPEGIAVEAVETLPPDTSGVLLTDPASDAWQVSLCLLNLRRVAIVGAGHCGMALGRQMAVLRYAVSVFDHRRDLHTAQLRDSLPVTWVDGFADAGGRIRYPELTAAVVMTPDYPSDVAALSGLLPHPFPFLGAMGAKAKIQAIRRSLAEHGFAKADLDRVVAPIGLPIESDTPEEIAVSVAAQILQHRATALTA